MTNNINIVNSCSSCKHIRWMIAIGYGLRCGNPKNQDKIFREEERDPHREKMGPLVPSRDFACEHFQEKEVKELD